MAGLLTDSHLEAFPVARTSGDSVVSRCSSDCPGFTPDSLLIHIPEWYMRNRFGGKDSIFYLTIHFSQAGIYGIHGSQVKFRTISSQEKLMHKALKINIKKTG